MTLEAGFPLGSIVSDSHHILVVREGDSRVRKSHWPSATCRPTATSSSVSRRRTATRPRSRCSRRQKEDGDYFLALIMPRASESRTAHRPREAIFVLDNSGSMGGESIRQAKAGLLLALERLTPADRFNVIRFDDTMTQLYPRAVAATAENIAYAKGYVVEHRGERRNGDASRPCRSAQRRNAERSILSAAGDLPDRRRGRQRGGALRGHRSSAWDARACSPSASARRRTRIS